MSRQRVVGFDRTLELSWLDFAAAKVAEGLTVKEVRQALWDFLEGVVPGERFNSGRGKTVTVLTRIWANVPESVQGLRDRAAHLVGDVSSEERVALHWAMACAVYPYFFDAATSIGQVLKLQGDVSVPHLTARLGQRWGQRELIQRTAEHVTRSMRLWGALEETDKKTVFTRKPAIELSSPTSVVLAEALVLVSAVERLPFDQFAKHPAFFPFSVTHRLAEFRSARHFAVHRDASVNMLSLRR